MDPASIGKWLYAVQATRAWRVVQEDWKRVEQLLPAAYASAHSEYIGSSGVQVGMAEAELLLQLDVYEVTVYGRENRVNGTIHSLESASVPSRAIPPRANHIGLAKPMVPSTSTSWNSAGVHLPKLMAGPSLRLASSEAHPAWRDQIQSAYPDGQFKWMTNYPHPVPDAAPYETAGCQKSRLRCLRRSPLRPSITMQPSASGNAQGQER